MVLRLRGSQGVQGEEFPFRARSGTVITGLFSADVIVVDGQECILSSIGDISSRKQMEGEREELIRELREALGKVKILSGLLPICSSCKKIRDDKGSWTQLEAYFARHSEAEFSHGICPECLRKLYPEYADAWEKKERGGGPEGATPEGEGQDS